MQTFLSLRRLVVAMLAVLVIAGLPAAAFAQATRGTILGTITDQTGAAMPGATVVATETRTNVSHDTVTNETGNFTFPNISDGIYNIKAELQGFKTVVREGIRLAVNTSIRVDLALAVGELAETVTVSGETPLLQTDRTDTGRTLESIQVTAMPLSFNRNFQGMMATVPGASRPYKPHSEFFNSQDSLSSEVNGQSRLSNNVLIEGLDNNQRTGLLTVLDTAGRGHRRRQRRDEQLRRRVRPRGRRGDVGHPEVGHQLAQGQRLLVRQHREDQRAAGGLVLLDDADQAADDLQPVRLHHRRADQEEQVVLLRRLPADTGSARRRSALRRADRGLPPG